MVRLRKTARGTAPVVEEPRPERTRRRAKPLWRVVASLFIGLAMIGGYAAWQSRLRNAAVTPPSPKSTVASSVPDAAPPVIDTVGIDIEVGAALSRDRDLVIQQPQSAAPWGNLGMTFYAHEYVEAAITCLAQAEKLDTRDVRWPYLLGRAWRAINPDESVAALERAVVICGNDPPAVRLTLSEVLLESYRLDDAERQLKSYQMHNSNDLRARLDLARLASLRGETEQCYEQLQIIQQLFNADPRYRNRGKSLGLLMAESLRRLGRVDEAEQVRMSADKQSDPTWEDPLFKQVGDRQVGLKKYLNQGEAFFRSREYEQSIDLLGKAAELYPDSIWAKILLARALIRTGAPDSNRPDGPARLDRAVSLLEDSLRIDPNSVESIFRLAVAKGYQRKLGESVALYRRAIQIKPDFTMAYFNLAGVLWNELHDQEGAIEAFEGALRAEPDFVDGHYLYGVVLMRIGQYAEAEPHFETVVRLQPNNANFRSALAESRRRQQK